MSNLDHEHCKDGNPRGDTNQELLAFVENE